MHQDVSRSNQFETFTMWSNVNKFWKHPWRYLDSQIKTYLRGFMGSIKSHRNVLKICQRTVGTSAHVPYVAKRSQKCIICNEFFQQKFPLPIMPSDGLTARQPLPTPIPIQVNHLRSFFSAYSSIRYVALCCSACRLRMRSHMRYASCWLRGTAVERWSLTGDLSLSCTRPAVDGWPLMWVNRPL